MSMKELWVTQTRKEESKQPYLVAIFLVQSRENVGQA